MNVENLNMKTIEQIILKKLAGKTGTAKEFEKLTGFPSRVISRILTKNNCLVIKNTGNRKTFMVT